MSVSNAANWMMKTVLAVGLVAGLAVVSASSPGPADEAVLRALVQHDPNADNTFPRSTAPVDGKGGEDISGPYEVVADWPQPLHNGWQMGRTAGVYAESPDRLYVVTTGEIPSDYQGERRWGPTAIPKLFPVTSELTTKKGRWEHNLLVFDRNGKLIESWEQWNSTLKTSQRIQVNPYDPERHIWLTSGGQILKFTHDGKSLVQTIGPDVLPKTDRPARFGPEELSWMPNGDFYVCAGTRVIKFSKEGKYLSEFGKPGKGPGEFNGIHGVIVDPTRHRLYVADRGNSRIQVLDENGQHLDTWPNIVAPYCIRLTKDGRYLWASDGYTQKVLKYDVNGKLLTSWGTFGAVPGGLWGPHYFTTDSEGNLYVAEDYNARVQKFRPREDGNPQQLIGPLQ
ncbi:MAG: 6-bladed beta-propeller [Acidobacteria bacterium]|nr:6-bladed beta-propeller [Acidobacteriota bacterium]